MDEIVERGYAGASMQSIATRAGASKETLYSWFGDRDGLVTALIRANADASATRLRDALSAPPRDLVTARQTLTAYASALLRLLTGDISVALNRAAMSSPHLAEILLTSGRHRIGPIAEEYFAALHAAGLIDQTDAAAAYRTFYGLVVQDTQIRVLLGEPTPSTAQVTRRAADAVQAFFRLHPRPQPARRSVTP